MRNYLYNAFVIPSLILLAITGIILLTYPGESIHLSINTFHHPSLDTIFKYITHLGDGIAILVVVLILLMINFKNSLILFIAFLISGGITQFLKKIIFHNSFRPVKFFEGKNDLRLVEGVQMHEFHSFPSGHATASFALFFCLSMMVKNETLRFFLFILATFSAFSRVYLSQHFLEDIFLGAIIGIGCSMITYILLSKYIPDKFAKPVYSLRNK